MIIVLNILVGISVISPIYTYAIYPFILRLFKPKKREIMDNYSPEVSVLIIGNNDEKCKEKENNIKESDYTKIVEIITVSSQAVAVKTLFNIKSEVVLVTDEESMFQKDTISQILKTLSGSLVGCVCGMVRKKPNEKGEFCDGANWKYENIIKVLESNVSCLSGANMSIYAFKRDVGPVSFDSRINLDFYLPTTITEAGYDVLFEPQAVVYEPSERSEQDLFRKHVADGASGYRSILRFWRLLLSFRMGSFVFWSHRVMKWLVPFNMLILLIGCAILSSHYVWASVFLSLQLLFYLYVMVYYTQFTVKDKDLPGPVGKISGFACYFVILNVSWFLGFLKALTR